MLIHLTYIGAATVLIEIDGYRILTDPALDPAGQHYSFGWGTGSTKTATPKLPADGLGKIDLVLLSHDQHADNLDKAGRRMLQLQNPCVLTTPSGAKRLGLPSAIGLQDWQSHSVRTPSGLVIKITATPARHGPPLSLPVVGHVTGFVLEWPGQIHGALYFTGDTVWFKPLNEVGQRFQIGTAFLHLGQVKFGLSGPVKYTFNAEQGIRMARSLGARARSIPIHFEDWSHFSEGRGQASRKFAEASPPLPVTWLERGVRTAWEA